ncbi:MAG: hypothetical protein WDM88_09110 [Galbitalea sp.]
MRASTTRGLLGVTAAFALAAAGVIVPAQASIAAVTPLLAPPVGAGADISFPQCTSTSHVDLPANIPFAVIGVNGGVANNDNRCLRSEYNSALLLTGRTEQPHASVYVNTGNPALAATWWPTARRHASRYDRGESVRIVRAQRPARSAPTSTDIRWRRPTTVGRVSS